MGLIDACTYSSARVVVAAPLNGRHDIPTADWNIGTGDKTR